MPLSLRQIRYFVALAETGGFGAAAQSVRVSQPALSLQIKELEADLGVRLVERHPRGIRLTRAGQEALRRARRILAEAADLQMAVRNADALRGDLALGIIPTVAPYLLPPLLPRLEDGHPELRLRVREAHTSALLPGLAGGHLDAVVVADHPGPGLDAEALLRDRFLLAGSLTPTRGWSPRASSLRPTDLPEDQLLLLEEGHCLAGQALLACGVPRRNAADLGAASLSTLVGLVAKGFGVTLLPEIAAATEAREGLLLLRFAAPEPARTLHLVTRPGSGPWAAQLAGMLREALTEAIAQAEAVCPAQGGHGAVRPPGPDDAAAAAGTPDRGTARGHASRNTRAK